MNSKWWPCLFLLMLVFAFRAIDQTGTAKSAWKEVATWSWELWWPKFLTSPNAAGKNGTAPRSRPIQAPDLRQCGPAVIPLPATRPTDYCCPPSSPTVVEYKLPPPSAPLRIRPAAHLVTPEYVAKYAKAMELARSLPADDPRNFDQQAVAHCAYCNGDYHQVGFPGLELQIHTSWLFLAWHRCFLHFHERILGSLIDDPTFALPFWNWDNPPGMQFPSMYTNASSSLYDKLRNPKHQPPAIVHLDFAWKEPPTNTSAQQIDQNLKIIYRQVVSNGKTTRLFLGSPYRAGEAPYPGMGSVENSPHGPVHFWTGDKAQPNSEDMGSLYSAGYDPTFYAHHGNLDRIWEVWRGLGGKRANFDDEDWLETAFVFYDENKQLVRIKIRDCLDAERMRYKYQEVEIPWLTSRPKPAFGKKTTNTSASTSTAPHLTVKFPVTLEAAAVSTTVRRPRAWRSEKEKQEEEEVLVVEGIEVAKDVYVKVDVYVNAPTELVRVTPAASEFAGSFVSVPHRRMVGKRHKMMKTSLRLGITDLLEDLEAEGQDSIVVTLVPRYREGNISVNSVCIEFER